MAIRLRLVFLNPNNDETSDVAPAYKSGDRIAIRLNLNHSLNEPITFTDFANKYRDMELELRRDGHVVRYSKEGQRSVERTRIEPPNESSATRQYLHEKDYVLRRIDLPEWYDNLLPGHYQLIVKRRFVWGGEWVSSDSIIFDVGPPEAPDHAVTSALRPPKRNVRTSPATKPPMWAM